MPIRVTHDEVGCLLDDPPADLQPFITTAARLVDELLVPHAPKEAILQEVEKYLAAHFAELSRAPKGGAVSQRIGDWSASYDGGTRGDPRLGALSATHHGRTAMAIDVTGILADVGKPTTRFAAL